MPKKFSIVDKRGWLDKYESGMSEVTIASKTDADVRTIKKGIDEARRERDAQLARSELLKQALLGHQEKLKGALEDILRTLTLPARDWAMLSWNRNGESIFDEGKSVTETSPPKTMKTPDDALVQIDITQEMLREHLRNDNLWKILSRWAKSMSTHQTQRITLQYKVVSILEKETGFKVVDINISEPFLYSYTAGDLFYRMILRWAFGDENTDWQEMIMADNNSGAVKYHGSILAEVRGVEEECRINLLKAFDKMKTLPETIQVKVSYNELQKETIKARRAVEEILMLGLVPGQCRVCRRLGA